MKRTVAFLVGLAVFLEPAAAGAAPFDPSDRPETSGPVIREGRRCFDRVLRNDGQTLGRATFCAFPFSFSPAAETDVARDYGAMWVQLLVDPARRFCLTRTSAVIAVPQEVSLHARTPRSTLSTDQTRMATARLRLTADGHAPAPGTIRQDYPLRPKTVDPQLEGRTFRAVWDGRTGGGVALVAGVEFSYEAVGSPGTFEVGMGVSRFVRC